LATYNNLDIAELEKWSFLPKWHTLTADEKLEKYNEFMGHELNVFLYFKDVDFFSQYVSQHIEHKSSKELIDYFLIGDLKKVKSLCRVNNLDKLNILEIALAILLMRSEDPSSEQECRQYLEMIKEKYETVKLVYDEKGSLFKQRFDTILNSLVTKQAATHASTLNVGGLRATRDRARNRDYDRRASPMARGPVKMKRRLSTAYINKAAVMQKKIAPAKKAKKQRKRSSSYSECSSDDASICSESSGSIQRSMSRQLSMASQASVMYSTCMEYNINQEFGVLPPQFNELPTPRAERLDRK
jgi:hypothetical protein